jgi:hypothetical protein
MEAEMETGRVEGDNDELADAYEEQEEESDSFVKSLREKRKAIAENITADFDIPGYDGVLVARYRRDPDIWDKFRKMADKLQKSKNPRKELLGQCDVLIKTCDGFFLRQDGILYPLNEAAKDRGLDLGGDLDESIKYDNRLAAFLDFEASSARQVVLSLFNNELAVTAHHNDVGEWMQSSRTEDAQDF